jgi:hypothetical protein
MSRDLRYYARQTNIQLTIGFFLILLIIGEGLIYWLYGQQAALMGLLCIGAGLSPVVLIALFFLVVHWVLKRAGED